MAEERNTSPFNDRNQRSVPALDPKKVAEAVRSATPVSEFEKAMDKARGFHTYYEGTLDNAALTRLEQ